MASEIAPAYSIGNSQRINLQSNNYFTPSPGSYEIKLDKPAAFSFNKTPRPDVIKVNDIPGPDAYSLNYKNHQPKITIGKKPKERMQYKTPGPGDYHPESVVQSINYSLGNKTVNKGSLFDSKSEVPGPGMYAAKIESDSPRVSFPKAKVRRNPIKNPENPGPGYYDITKTFDSSFLSTFSKSKIKEKTLDTPGPGTYEVRKDIIPQTKLTFSTKTSYSPPISQTPGPAAYDPAHYQRKSTKQRKTSMFDISSELNYSGEYKPTNPISYSMGKGERHYNTRHFSVTPGPGSYNPEPKHLIPAAKVQISVNKDLKYLYETPGPGAYSPTVNSIVPTSVISSFNKEPKRKAKKKSFSPGPGYYDAEGKVMNAGYSWGKDAREYDKTAQMTIGPGTYEITSTLGKAGLTSLKSKHVIN